MKRYLITGATGNTGIDTLRYLMKLRRSDNDIKAGVRDVDSAKTKLSEFTGLDFVTFDLEKPDTFDAAVKDIDIVFLLRPPHISDVRKYFPPLFDAMKRAGVTGAVFLSVQGADKSGVIPHSKIEKLIREYDFDHIFLRPSYFMQNLTNMFIDEIREYNRITLPAGSAKFNWIDVKNIGEAAAVLLLEFELYKNKAYDITGKENLNFGEAVGVVSEVTGRKVRYKKINPLSYYIKQRKEGVSNGLALVKLLLHFLPRFQSEPEISDNYKMLTGREPSSLKEFIEREKDKFID